VAKLADAPDLESGGVPSKGSVRVQIPSAAPSIGSIAATNPKNNVTHPTVDNTTALSVPPIKQFPQAAA
jgi:hypothetical protein